MKLNDKLILAQHVFGMLALFFCGMHVPGTFSSSSVACSRAQRSAAAHASGFAGGTHELRDTARQFTHTAKQQGHHNKLALQPFEIQLV